MKKFSEAEYRAIFNKSDSDWTPREKDEIYWIHFHEMEDPTEEQIRYFCRHHSMRWYGFLLTLYPSEYNFFLLMNQHGRTKPGRRVIAGLLSKLVREEGDKLSLKCLELIRKLARPRKARRRAQIKFELRSAFNPS